MYMFASSADVCTTASCWALFFSAVLPSAHCRGVDPTSLVLSRATKSSCSSFTSSSQSSSLSSSSTFASSSTLDNVIEHIATQCLWRTGPFDQQSLAVFVDPCFLPLSLLADPEPPLQAPKRPRDKITRRHSGCQSGERGHEHGNSKTTDIITHMGYKEYTRVPFTPKSSGSLGDHDHDHDHDEHHESVDPGNRTDTEQCSNDSSGGNIRLLSPDLYSHSHSHTQSWFAAFTLSGCSVRRNCSWPAAGSRQRRQLYALGKMFLPSAMHGLFSSQPKSNDGCGDAVILCSNNNNKEIINNFDNSASIEAHISHHHHPHHHSHHHLQEYHRIGHVDPSDWGLFRSSRSTTRDNISDSVRSSSFAHWIVLAHCSGIIDWRTMALSTISLGADNTTSRSKVDSLAVNDHQNASDGNNNLTCYSPPYRHIGSILGNFKSLASLAQRILHIARDMSQRWKLLSCLPIHKSHKEEKPMTSILVVPLSTNFLDEGHCRKRTDSKAFTPVTTTLFIAQGLQTGDRSNSVLETQTQTQHESRHQHAHQKHHSYSISKVIQDASILARDDSLTGKLVMVLMSTIYGVGVGTFGALLFVVALKIRLCQTRRARNTHPHQTAAQQHQTRQLLREHGYKKVLPRNILDSFEVQAVLGTSTTTLRASASAVTQNNLPSFKSSKLAYAKDVSVMEERLKGLAERQVAQDGRLRIRSVPFLPRRYSDQYEHHVNNESEELQEAQREESDQNMDQKIQNVTVFDDEDGEQHSRDSVFDWEAIHEGEEMDHRQVHDSGSASSFDAYAPRDSEQITASTMNATRNSAGSRMRSTSISLAQSLAMVPPVEESRCSMQAKHVQVEHRLPFANANVQTMCAICLSKFEVGEHVRTLPCYHQYHQGCIDPWLLQVASLCPICKRDLSPGWP